MHVQNTKLKFLLPISFFLFILPFIFPNELVNFISLPIFYFFASFFALVNFKSIGEILYNKPIYLEDLVLEHKDIIDDTFMLIYGVVMNFILSLLFAMFSEYIVIKDIKNLSIIEIFGIIGGNLSLYFRIQSITGKIIIKIFYYMKEKKIEIHNNDNLNHQIIDNIIFEDKSNDCLKQALVSIESHMSNHNDQYEIIIINSKQKIDDSNNDSNNDSNDLNSESQFIHKRTSFCVPLSPEPFKLVGNDSLIPLELDKS